MTDTYRVLFTGRLKPGVDPEQVAAAFAARFGVQPGKVRDMLEAGGEVVLSSGLTASEAQEHAHALDRMGMVVRIEPPVDETGGAVSLVTDPREGKSAPGAGELHPPRVVPAAHGWHWLRDGFSMVLARPADWIVAIVVWVLLNTILNFIPVVNIVSGVVTPVFMGGIMLGAFDQDSGGKFGVGHLFSGFTGNRLGPLVLVGALYMAGLVAIGLIVVFILGVAGLIPTGGVAGLDAGLSAELAAGQGAVMPLMLAVLLGLVLAVPLFMAYWFAPVLVVVDGVSAFNAMDMSFRASLKNIWPFTVYGLAAPALLIAGAIPLFLGLLVVIPAIVASVYASYRDIFRD